MAPLVYYNIMKQYQSAKRAKINSNRQMPTSVSKQIDSNYMIAEMKQLLKENTALKQENLILKQQITLSKIQIQNLQLKLEQTLVDHRESVIMNVANTQENNKNHNKKHMSRHNKLKSELTKQIFLQNTAKQKQQSTLKQFKRQALKQISEHSTVTNTTDKSKNQSKKVQTPNIQCSPAKRNEQMQQSRKIIKNQRSGKSLSRKQQIMNKYRPFLQINDQLLIQKLEMIRSNR